jgi:hypothetical protein
MDGKGIKTEALPIQYTVTSRTFLRLVCPPSPGIRKTTQPRYEEFVSDVPESQLKSPAERRSMWRLCFAEAN